MRVYGECEHCRGPITRKYSGGNRLTRFCSRRCADAERASRRRMHPAPPPVRDATWIPLTRGEFALVDRSDFARVSEYTWMHVNGKAPRHGRRDGSEQDLHRFIMQPKGREIVDHRDGNTLDNRRSNLRVASPSGNQRNMRKWGAGRFKGVYRNRSAHLTPRWYAKIRVEGSRSLYLGSFSSEEEAARAYDRAAREHHGEFACVNFPQAGERSAL